ncbi:MAG TPA: hypothetical protein VJ371_18670, partial [Streptosporangiaceae bacterium]|nr:hypothetical protein [Streptosporangiaceae bacterium]
MTGSERPASQPRGLFGRRGECGVLGGLLKQVRDGRSAVLAAAEAGPPDALLRARIGLLRGQMAFGSGRSADASALLLRTAQRLERL